MNQLVARDIREVWDDVGPGIAEALRRGGSDYRPEDIYAACVAGRAWCYSPDESPQSSAILAIGSDLTGKQFLEIICSYSPDHDVQGLYLHQFEELAREAGIEIMRFYSARKAWQRNKDWTSFQTEYRRRVA